MAYSERIKDFGRIRDFMRSFYVYGFKGRGEYDAKSPRSYDNERRRVESWLGDYMSFRRDAAGKKVFLSVDSRQIPGNPLYKAFKAKSFTNKDITLHFYILDILAGQSALSAGEIIDRIHRDYLSRADAPFPLDESTLRKKLQEYAALGLLCTQKDGRHLLYRRAQEEPSLPAWADALAFYAEENPVGVIGSYLADRLGGVPDIFRFKHHYILHALDSDILCRLLLAIDGRQAVELTLKSLRDGRTYRRTVCPLKIYSSTEAGRRYLLGYHYRGRQMSFYRLDAIQKVTPGRGEKKFSLYLEEWGRFDGHLWGVSANPEGRLDHLEMTLHIGPGEDFLLQRLEREKRHGRVAMLDGQTCRFSADVYDAAEMLPWLRTFTGRITELRCSRQEVVDTFYADLRRMEAMYGGDGHAVQ